MRPPFLNIQILCEMKNVDKQNPAHSVICHNRNKVVYRCDKRTGRNRWINVNFLKEQRYKRSDRTRKEHCHGKRYTDTPRNRVRKQQRLVFKKVNVKTYQNKRQRSQ